jgi:hypothetical protein
MQKNTHPYSCELCDFNCSKKSNYDIHLTTAKHVSRTKSNELTQKNTEKPFFCDICKKYYKSKSGFWYHKQKCLDKNNIKNILPTGEDIPTLTQMFMEVMKQNKELQNQLFEMAKEKSAITNNGTINNNTMNNKFNLQIFLNETCKDAMNIQEFIDFCKVQHSDFENFGKYGYVESMTRIIMRNLMELEVHRRPIHCTDAKREVLYVKDNNVWVNDFSREKLIRAIKYIAAKNVKQIPGWMDHNPDSKNTQTKLHDKYMRMVCHSMGGRDEAEDQEYYKKIIRNVAKEVIIDKMR